MNCLLIRIIQLLIVPTVRKLISDDYNGESGKYDLFINKNNSITCSTKMVVSFMRGHYSPLHRTHL